MCKYKIQLESNRKISEEEFAFVLKLFNFVESSQDVKIEEESREDKNEVENNFLMNRFLRVL